MFGSKDGKDTPETTAVSRKVEADNENDQEEYYTKGQEENDDEPDANPDYDYLWNDPQCFSEEHFYKNFVAERKWTDIAWTIIFWINLLVTVGLFAALKPGNTDSFEDNAKSITTSTICVVGIIAIGISFAIVFFTLVFVWFFPRAYVRFSAVISITVGLAALIPVASLISPYFLIFGGVIVLYIAFVAIRSYKRIAFSACVMNASAVVLREYPSLFFFNLLMFIIQSGLSYIFSTGSFLVWANGISYWVYIYVAFSYFFIVRTVTYVTYSICAGVASSWYFLNGSEYEIKHPILFSVKNAIGPNFGPSALAGLLEGITSMMEWLKEQSVASPGCCCMACFQCCCSCFVCVMKCINGFVTKYSLIYCAMFGIPAIEGVKRWKKTKRNKLVKRVVNRTIIENTFSFYTSIASVVATSLGGIVGGYVYEKDSPEMVFLSTMCAFFALNGMSLISKPIIVLSDTLFIGFGEAPQRLETGAKAIYDLFDDESKELMEKDIAAANGEDVGCCC